MAERGQAGIGPEDSRETSRVTASGLGLDALGGRGEKGGCLKLELCCLCAYESLFTRS